MILSKVKDLRQKQIVPNKKKRNIVWKPSEQRTILFSVDGIEGCSIGVMIAGLVYEKGDHLNTGTGVYGGNTQGGDEDPCGRI